MKCLPGKHVWVDRIGFDGTVKKVCSICGKAK